MSYAEALEKAHAIDLSRYDANDTGKADKKNSTEEVTALGTELAALQELLYAAQAHSVLIVLQGTDTSGKDGTIAHVMSHVNPQGCAVAAFKVPTPEESAHDFLWRIHKEAPRQGMMTIFNRSHYEDVLVTRVHKLITKDECEARYAQIREFESLLVSNHTIILKFFLHITRDEQKERLLAREQDTEKAWKLSAGDWEERKFWDDYIKAYEEAIGATAAKDAPWYVIAANHKWFRNLAIADTLVKTLRPYKKDWEQALKKIGEERKAELAKFRESE